MECKRALQGTLGHSVPISQDQQTGTWQQWSTRTRGRQRGDRQEERWREAKNRSLRAKVQMKFLGFLKGNRKHTQDDGLTSLRFVFQFQNASRCPHLT